MRKLVLLSISALLMTAFAASAQSRTVTGRVVSETGQPIAGVAVVVDGTSTGTTTAIDGSFSIFAPVGAVLRFSFLGFQAKEIAIGNRAHIDLVLREESTEIDRVVVTAMGITRSEKTLGFAAQELSGSVITQANSTDLAGALQGKLSGVDIIPSSGMPGASSQFMIRGARSFLGNNNPLYVVDGMPINSGIDVSTYEGNTGNGGVAGSDYANRGIDIDPNDIESVNVLKGQAAAALYGMRASNGVVLITTKSGRGNEKGRTFVSFNSSVSFERISRYPDYQREYAQGSNGLYLPYDSKSWGPKIVDLPNDPNYGGSHQNQNNSHPGMYRVPQLEEAGLDGWVYPDSYNNIKDFFDMGFTINNSVNVSRATDNNVFSLTLGATNQEGIVPKTGMDRYNLKLLAESKLNKAWTAGFSGNFVSTDIKKSTGANEGLIATVFNLPPSYNLKGIPYHVPNEEWNQINYRQGQFDHPIWATKNNVFSEQTNRFFGNAFVAFKPDLGSTEHSLNFKLQGGADAYASKYHEIFGYGHANEYGVATERLYDVTNFNGLLTADYRWKISDRWEFDALLGMELINEKTKKLYSNGRNFNFPGWNHMKNATVFLNEESVERFRSAGFFGSVTLGFDNMLFLTVTGRNDVISSMPRNNRSFFYPSVSLSWVFTELEALKGNRVLTFGKLRASFAQIGQPGEYYLPYYEIPSYLGGFYNSPPFVWPYDGMTAFQPSTILYDPDLKPQNTNSYEVGFDSFFLRGLLGLDYTFTYQDVRDQIFRIPYAASTGISEIMRNGGRLTTKSHEVTLSVTPDFRGDFAWTTSFNLTFIDNTVKKLAPGVESIYLGGFVTPQVRASVGSTFPTIYGESYLRNDDGQIVLGPDKMPIVGEPKALGSPTPKFILGANTSFTWKDLTLNAVFHWKHGGKMYNGTKGMMDFYGTSKASARAREEGIRYSGVDENDNPVDVYLTSYSDIQRYYNVLSDITEAHIYDASFLKLREISLHYKIPKLKKLDLTVNVFARNILLWSKMKDFDPEASQGNDNMAGAFERFSLPQTSSYGLGISIRF